MVAGNFLSQWKPWQEFFQVDLASVVRLSRPIESTFTYLFVHADRFGQRVIVWVGQLKIPLACLRDPTSCIGTSYIDAGVHVVHP
jgi:hypothetical protein